MGMILRIASSRIVGQGDIVGRSGYFSLNLSANSVMRGRLDARRTLKSLVADLRSSASLAVSLLIGLPLMYIGIQQIDKIVTYESSFPWWVPVAAFLIVALISLASVWLISRKTVRENPVLNLKTE